MQLQLVDDVAWAVGECDCAYDVAVRELVEVVREVVRAKLVPSRLAIFLGKVLSLGRDEA